MKIRFWGTRGSIAKAGPTTLRYGGNTSCVEVRSAAGDLLILDAGTGMHGLAQALIREPTAPRTSTLLLSHTHWDHIQGLPFFTPLFVPGQRWSIYGPSGAHKRLDELLREQMSRDYFPVGMDDLSANVGIHSLKEGHFTIGDISVTTRFLNHPGVTLGYRIVVDGKTLVYSTDHEPHSRHLASCGGAPAKGSEDAKHGEFLAGADVVIHDAQYTAEEYHSRVGWGHSTMEYVTDLAQHAGVRRLMLFHHDPNRGDADVDRLVERARARVSGRPGATLIDAAAEGQQLEATPSRVWAVAPERPQGEEDSALGESPRGANILIFAPSYPSLIDAAREVGQRPQVANQLLEAEAAWRATHPTVVIIEAKGPEEFNQRWRFISASGGWPSAMTRVMVCNDEPEPEQLRGVPVDSVLVAPFSPSYACSRMLVWTTKTPPLWERPPRPPTEAQRLRQVDRARRALQAAELRDELQTHVDLARALLADVASDDLVTAIHLIGAEAQESMARADGPTPTLAPSGGVHRDDTFCGHVVARDAPLEVEDTLNSADFRYHPHVLGSAALRAYVGVPLRIQGQCVGTLCAWASHPFSLNDRHRASFHQLARLISLRLQLESSTT
ncbi:MBL fold metallo-hydrolase [Myxococcota bacterium]|nr:MBL fold metallo-hydrolase [Myxococcota bacterium]